MIHTFSEFGKTSNLTLDFEIHQHLGSLKYVINVIMWIRDTGYYSHVGQVQSHFLWCGARR
jgi:hypothetical protein